MLPDRIHLLGVPVDCVTMSQSLVIVESILETVAAPQMIVAVNPEKIMAARKNSGLLGVLEQAGLLIPDGIGVVMGARLLKLGYLERVPGAELMPKICDLAARKGHSLFLFGGTPVVNRRAVIALRQQYPGIRIAGFHHGYVAEKDMPHIIDRINRSGADILFLALGSPRQEQWMAQALPHLRVKVCQGVGGTLDVLTGMVQRAPAGWRKWHVEWLYRLVTDPRRLWRQRVLPHFTWLILKERAIG